MRALFALLICAATSSAAQDIRFQQPLDCVLGKTCFIEDYVDTDPDERQAQDFTCGFNTRDGHKGTDFALLDFSDITKGVSVFAAADGQVLRTRDKMPDDRLQRGVTSNNACGNAVIIAHGDGYTSTYCHLKLGSVRVVPGEAIKAGQVLGLVGLSGQTSHPHLHFQVSKNNMRIDPFRPFQSNSCETAQPEETLWVETPEYHASILRFAGFSNSVPEYKDMRSAKALLKTSAGDQPLVLYIEAGLTQHGDVLEFYADGPNGEIFSHSILMKSPRKSERRAFGKRAPAKGWASGEYTGRVTLTRKGEIIANRFAHVTVVN
ncbi:M23 family metallopeptidase [Planktotalea sp.]|uniref:M23 family metallopeptidase n=1 Tax=Planktotalea sp. TaxID=2029877 RepID=UPI003D6B360B